MKEFRFQGIIYETSTNKQQNLFNNKHQVPSYTYHFNICLWTRKAVYTLIGQDMLSNLTLLLTACLSSSLQSIFYAISQELGDKSKYIYLFIHMFVHPMFWYKFISSKESLLYYETKDLQETKNCLKDSNYFIERIELKDYSQFIESNRRTCLDYLLYLLD